MNILFWITSAVKQAVLKGFAEAVNELELETDTSPDPLAALQARVNQSAALAAPHANGDRVPARKK